MITDLKEALLTEHSKSNTLRIAAWIGDDPGRFNELWEIIKTGAPPLPQRASWVFGHCCERFPDLLKPHLDEIVSFLPLPHHNSIHRNFCKTLATIDIPEEHQGTLYSLAIDWIFSQKVPVAVKAHCMEIAYKIARPIPELREELAIVITDQMDYGSAGFKSRARIILKRLKQKY